MFFSFAYFILHFKNSQLLHILCLPQHSSENFEFSYLLATKPVNPEPFVSLAFICFCLWVDFPVSFKDQPIYLCSEYHSLLSFGQFCFYVTFIISVPSLVSLYLIIFPIRCHQNGKLGDTTPVSLHYTKNVDSYT